jgi:phospholipase/lecithinase/hemolysin
VHSALLSCAGYAFADTIHPTSALHHALANAMLGPLGVPELATGALFGLGLVGIVLRRGSRF